MYKTILNRKVLFSIVFILGIKILQQHLKSENLSLYIDAKGGVVKKPSKMKGKIFYYALVLPGAGIGRPSLPVAYMRIYRIESALNKLYCVLQLYKKVKF